MRPAYAGKRLQCIKCQKGIEIGERVVKETRKDEWGYIKSFPLHMECALEGRREWLEKWFQENLPRQRVLRRKCADPVKRRSLLSLRRYHELRGNFARVGELDEEIKGLEDEYQAPSKEDGNPMTLEKMLAARDECERLKAQNSVTV